MLRAWGARLFPGGIWRREVPGAGTPGRPSRPRKLRGAASRSVAALRGWRSLRTTPNWPAQELKPCHLLEFSRCAQRRRADTATRVKGSFYRRTCPTPKPPQYASRLPAVEINTPYRCRTEGARRLDEQLPRLARRKARNRSRTEAGFARQAMPFLTSSNSLTWATLGTDPLPAPSEPEEDCRADGRLSLLLPSRSASRSGSPLVHTRLRGPEGSRRSALHREDEDIATPPVATRLGVLRLRRQTMDFRPGGWRRGSSAGWARHCVLQTRGAGAGAGNGTGADSAFGET